MPRAGKRYICVDWNFFDDAEADGLTPLAERLFIRALINCGRRESDGVLSRLTLRSLGGHGYHRSLKLLVEAGWIIEKDCDTFYIPSWPKWNEATKHVSARRTADRHRKRLKNAIPPDAFRIPD